MIDQHRHGERSLAEPDLGTMRLVWVGRATDPEMVRCLGWACDGWPVDQAASVDAACETEREDEPAVLLVPLNWSGAVRDHDLVRLARRWPLAVLVVVVGSCVDGWRRRGPPLAGALPVPWYELPGQLRLWARQREAGVAGALGAPTTSRREDRLLARVAAHRSWRQPVLQAAVAAGSRLLLESLEGLAAAAGTCVVDRHQGCPPVDAAGDVVLWDVGSVDERAIEHVARLHDARPGRPILVLESFPRDATASAVLAAGGAHLLGRPVEADVLAETIRWCWQPRLG